MPSIQYPMFNLDMDGCSANLDLHYENLFGQHPSGHTDEQFWVNVNSQPTFFRTIPVHDDFRRVFELASNFRHGWLTSCPKDSYLVVAQQKKEWLHELEFMHQHTYFCPVPGKKNKVAFMQNKGDVLIDDLEENINQWIEHGGRGILHRTVDQTIREIIQIVNEVEGEMYV
jgi:5'(3')-deoxyribonucleotidase